MSIDKTSQASKTRFSGVFRSVRESPHLSTRNLLVVMVSFALIGSILLFSSHAATPTVSLEPESKTVTSPATVGSDATASGGQYVQFKAASGGATCPAYPAFPDTSCVGWRHTGVTLTPYTGPSSITTSGTVIDSKDITTCLDINASNVTIKRSWIQCPGDIEANQTYGIWYNGGNNPSGLVLEDVEIMSKTVPSNCTMGDPPLLTRPIYNGGNGYRFTRVYFHNTRSGIGIGSNGIIEDSVMLTDCNPDPHNGSGADWQHSSAIGSPGGSTNVVVRHTVLDNGAENASGAIQLYPEQGPNDNITFDRNLVNARAYYCAYFGYTKSVEQPNTRLTITNNVWGNKYNADCGANTAAYYLNLDITKFNTAYPQGWGNIWSGNTWRNGQVYNLGDVWQ